MKVTFLQIDLVMGARILMSLLKEEGHEIKALQINIKYIDTLDDDDLDEIFTYIADSEVICLSFNSFYAIIAEKLAKYLKEKGIPYIITGGNHATALPDEVIRYSDIVVIYEAEISLPAIINCLEMGGDLAGVKGIIFKRQDEVIRTSEAPDVVWDLDSLPFQCIDTNVIKYYDKGKKIYSPKTMELFRPSDWKIYFILASRGCPFSCTYCSNSLYHSLDKKFKKIRKRSIPNIISEMEYALSHGFTSFYITDDHFMSFTLEEITQFNSSYKEKINKPFSIVGINPNNFRSTSAEEKLKLLLDCGMSDIRIGIQSGSNRTLSIFNRGYTANDVQNLVKVVEKYTKTIWNSPYDQLNIALDFICDAPWETDADRLATINLAQHIMKRYTIFFYTLVYLPGTDIYQQACVNGWVDNNEKDIYLKGIAGVDDNIFNRILFLIAVIKERGFSLPDPIINYILEMGKSDQEMAYMFIDAFIDTVSSVENHHGVNLKHAALHPYLTGFNEYTKKYGDVGRKVLFRNYYEPYG